jgi:hypothetical protein
MRSPLQFGAGEIAVAVDDRFEFAAIDGDQMFSEQSQLLTQHNELATDASDGLAVVFSEVGNGLEVRHQTPGQLHQFDIALGFSLHTSARLNAVEITVDVHLQQDRGVVSRRLEWHLQTQIDQLQFVDEDVDYAHRIGIADVVVEALGKLGALTSMFTLDKALHGRSLR